MISFMWVFYCLYQPANSSSELRKNRIESESISQSGNIPQYKKIKLIS